MSRRLRKTWETLLGTRDFAAGVLIGSGIVTPVFAAGDIAVDDVSTPILIGALILLIAGLALKARRGKAESKPGTATAGPKGFDQGIGRYRLQLGRGDAD